MVQWTRKNLNLSRLSGQMSLANEAKPTGLNQKAAYTAAF